MQSCSFFFVDILNIFMFYLFNDSMYHIILCLNCEPIFFRAFTNYICYSHLSGSPVARSTASCRLAQETRQNSLAPVPTNRPLSGALPCWSRAKSDTRDLIIRWLTLVTQPYYQLRQPWVMDRLSATSRLYVVFDLSTSRRRRPAANLFSSFRQTIASQSLWVFNSVDV